MYNKDKIISREIRAKKDLLIFKTHVRYLQFYLAVIYFLSLYSYILDYVFYKIDYGTFSTYHQNIGYYILVFILYYCYFTVPFVLIYNYAINNWVPEHRTIRLLAGLFAGLFIGSFIGGSGVGLSIYIGQYRWLKHLLVFSLTGITVELVRILVVRLRLSDNKFNR
jgi:hypothetical protein